MRELCTHIEKYWETSGTKKNDQQSKANPLKKYGGLHLKGDNDGIIYTINPRYIEWEK